MENGLLIYKDMQHRLRPVRSLWGKRIERQTMIEHFGLMLVRLLDDVQEL